MAYYIHLKCGNGYSIDSASGTLICNAVGPNEVLNTNADYPSLTTADIGVLLSAALGIWALAWGFRMVGSLIYKSS